jgi:hypothetical protein
LTSFADLKEACVSESLRKERAPEMLYVIWKYAEQHLSQEMLLGEEEKVRARPVGLVCHLGA